MSKKATGGISVKTLLSLGLLLITSALMAQEPVSTFATVGRYEHHTWAGRGAQKMADKVNDHFDRIVCCGYAKSHNEVGVPGLRGTKAFMWGSSCEFFTEPCRTPPVSTGRWNRTNSDITGEIYGNGISNSCTQCGR